MKQQAHTRTSEQPTTTVEGGTQHALPSSPAEPSGSASPGVLGVDTIATISSATAQQLRAAGFGFCIRYVGLGPTSQATVVTPGEANGILQAGLSLVLVQFARQSVMSADQGTADGKFAAESAASLGAPQGMNVFCDLEGVSSFGQNAVIAYGNAWYEAVTAGDYTPGLYVGSGLGLTGDQLYHELLFQHYWRSLSQVPNIPVRGYQMLQLSPANQKVCGINIDIDVTQCDYQGGTIQWWSPTDEG